MGNNYGMGQNFNPHNLRLGVIIDFNNDAWFEEAENIDYESKIYLRNKLNDGLIVLTYSSGLLERKIKLYRLLGKTRYKEIVNKIKVLSR